MRKIYCEDTKEVANSYSQYLKTNHWCIIKKLYRESSILKECIECGNKNLLNIHHKTYKNIGHENINDIVFLCTVCHKKEHIETVTQRLDSKRRTMQTLIDARMKDLEYIISTRTKTGLNCCKAIEMLNKYIDCDFSPITNVGIVEYVEITPLEQLNMVCLIGRLEKNRRRAAVKNNHIDDAKRELVFKTFDEGITGIRKIALITGMAIVTVRRYLFKSGRREYVPPCQKKCG